MSTAEIKVEIFREIDGLDEFYLTKIHKYIKNILEVKNETTEWDKLSSAQKSGLIDAIREADEGHVLSNNTVMSKYKKKYSNV